MPATFRQLPQLKKNILQGAGNLAGSRSLQILGELAAARGVQVYLVGGTVRELALGRPAPDLDLAVSARTLDLARDLAQALGGTFVLLDEAERTARVVWQGEILDLAEFRAPTLEEDLRARDFTINALALDLEALLGRQPLVLIDPWGGLNDLAQGLIRVVRPQNFHKDPLRLLRAYRFAATHGFRLTPETAAAIPAYLPEFARVAGERVRQELFILLAAPRAAAILQDMEQSGLLTRIFPECLDMQGVEQNGFHHLDVFRHSLLTAAYVEEVLAAPEKYFGKLAGALTDYVRAPSQAVLLKLAALFHDVGKPQVQGRRTDPDRYTFYYHERVGVEIFTAAALRLRLSQAETKTVTRLISLHMRPFLLLPAFREGELTPRALGRLVRAARPDLPGLFILAMADSLAGQGPQKPADAETMLADLAAAAYRFLKERIEPQERQPRLLTGHDLIKVLGLQPGPRFREILTAVEEAQWEGAIQSRQEALELARSLGREEPGS
ncbi:MAG: HD domain-containing protein [Thermodesulfobacteriota bacterium]